MGYFRGVDFRGGADLLEADAATLIAIQVLGPAALGYLMCSNLLSLAYVLERDNRCAV